VLHSFLRRALVLAASALLLSAATLYISAQTANPTSAANPFWGSVTASPATDQPLHLSLDDAVRRGLENNLGLKQAEDGEKAIKALKLQAVQNFLPNIDVTGSTGIFQHNLAALGFGPGVLKEFAGLIPGGGTLPANFSFITKDDLTQGQIHYGQMLFSGPVFFAWKGARAAEKAAYFGKMSARGEVVQQVATAYLHVAASSSEVDNARALEAEDRLLLNQADAAHQAGTIANLDVLRARTQLQAQQQVLIADENTLEKDLILLKREIGVDPGQSVQITDVAPYSELATQTVDEVRAVAYKNRQDYQNLQNQAVEMKAAFAVFRAERLPSLSFGGYYGVSKVNGVASHGDFALQGNLSVPLFREARLRGDVESAHANMDAVNAQLDDLRGRIDLQVRSALLDVRAATKLVEVARSNVGLATRALADETERVNAGVDDNLPLVTAQASLASAQRYLVESLFQFNLSKLVLARSAGVLETQYRDYLGR
jgi:outer membrane protein TolC